MKAILSVVALFIALFGLGGCGSGKAQVEHGKFEMEQGNYSSALRYFTQVKKQDPKFPGIDSLISLARKNIQTSTNP